MDGPFDLYAGSPPDLPASPVVVSVPHAGRDYPPSLLGAMQGPLATLRPLEDRYVDAVAIAARETETLIVQHRARAWIDLNRGEDERDPRVDEGATPTGSPTGSAKVKSGLGLVPRRAVGTSPIWARRFTDADIVARIAADHRPYHAALATTLARAQAMFGIAVLVDLHSMPPLGSGAAVVLGDRFGRAAAARFVARAEAAARGAGFATALNLPYAGGHILATHGQPAAGIHAIQVEIDRSRYLDAALDLPGAGLTPTVRMLRAMLDALTEEALGTRLDRAAE